MGRGEVIHQPAAPKNAAPLGLQLLRHDLHADEPEHGVGKPRKCVGTRIISTSRPDNGLRKSGPATFRQ